MKILNNLQNKRQHLLQGALVMLALCGFLFFFALRAFAAPGVVKTSNVNVRASADATSEAVGAVNEDDKVDILGEETGADGKIWYKVKLTNGVVGYIRSDFVSKQEEGAQAPDDEDEEQTQPTTVTPVTEKKAYVKGRTPVNIRKEASTTSAKVATAEGGSELTITGEATGTDGKKWYQVTFKGNGTTMKGFVRSDLLGFEAPEQEPEETEIEGELDDSETTEETTEPVSEETPSVPVPEEPVKEAGASVADLTLLEPVSTLENIPVGFEQTEIDDYTAWTKDNYFIIYAARGDEEPQWYLFDSVIKGYVRYGTVFSNQTVTVVKETPLFNWLSFVLIGVIAVLAGVVIFLIFKLSQNKGGYDDYEEYDDDDDGDDESDFEMELDDEEEAAPVQREMNYINQRPLENKTIEPKTLIMPAPELPETFETEESEVFAQEEEIEEEEQEEEVVPVTREKKGFGKKLLDYFTTEVDDDDDDEDDDDEIEEDEILTSDDDDDDDDDLNFIDI